MCFTVCVSQCNIVSVHKLLLSQHQTHHTTSRHFINRHFRQQKPSPSDRATLTHVVEVMDAFCGSVLLNLMSLVVSYRAPLLASKVRVFCCCFNQKIFRSVLSLL